MKPVAKDSDEDLFGFTPDHVYAFKILEVSAYVYSQWFTVARCAIARERRRRRREGDVYRNPDLTDMERFTVSMCSNITKSFFGQQMADYAMMKFRDAVHKGDKRSFKIRLLILRSRDSLKGTKLYKGFSEGAGECISNAEMMAGCKPDPSPRRMSNAEKKRAEAKKNRPPQPDLFNPVYDSEIKTQKTCAHSGKCTARHRTTSSIFHNAAPADPDVSHCKELASGSAGVYMGPVSSYICKTPGESQSVTVTPNRAISKKKSGKQYHKADIPQDTINTKPKSSGYRTNEEVVQDVKNGLITPADAVILLSEIMKRKRPSRSIGETIYRDIDNKIDRAVEDQTLYRGGMPISDIDEDIDSGDDVEDVEDGIYE